MSNLKAYKSVNFTKAAIDILAERIDKKKDGAFYICNVGEIISKYRRWQKAFAGYECFYSVQRNYNGTVLKLMKHLGSGFVCRTKGDLETIIDLGVDPAKIIYMHPQKRISFLEYAKYVGVNFLTFDTIDELHKIHNVFQTSGRLMMQLNVMNNDFLLPHRENLGVQRQDVDELLQEAKNLGMNVVGVCFDVGNDCNTSETLQRIVKYCGEVVEKGRKFGFDINIVEFDGGFVSYQGSPVSVDNVGATISEALKESFGGEDKSLKLVGDPAQFIVSSAFTLVTAVQGKKIVKRATCEDCDEDIVKRCCYYINESCYGSFGLVWTEFDLGIQPPTVIRSASNLEKDSGKDYPSAVYGESMHWLDCIYENDSFEEIFVGDHLLWHDWGVCWQATASEFSGLKTTDVYYIISEEMRAELEAITSLGKVGLCEK